MEIEISVLVGPVERVTSPLDIRVGRAHGLWIRRGAKEGVLLPQVAVEQGWDPFEFLNHATLKANLRLAVWQEPDTEIRTFKADVISASSSPRSHRHTS